VGPDVGSSSKSYNGRKLIVRVYQIFRRYIVESTSTIIQRAELTAPISDDEAKGAWGDFLEDRPVAPPRFSYLQERTMPPDDLERGQLEKLHRMIKRARIKLGSRVLEIGYDLNQFNMYVLSCLIPLSVAVDGAVLQSWYSFSRP
jgi:hypothetical protein